jgi:myo-inositol-1(or 4)-monophosphatase
MITLDDLTAHLKEIRTSLITDKRSILSEIQKDISLSTDQFLDKEITTFLQSNYPYPILSEESGRQSDFREFDDYFWIIDPLDGTLNYSRSIPISCISIALWQKQAPIIGIIYDFYHDEMFTGVVEKTEITGKAGAWLNDEPILTAHVQNKSQGVICTGFPSWRNYGTESLLNFVKKVQDWKKVRLIGSAALSLAWVACGRVDAYMEEDIRIWDVAAGLALVKAAGGNIYFKANERPNFVTAVATGKKISVKELL